MACAQGVMQGRISAEEEAWLRGQQGQPGRPEGVWGSGGELREWGDVEGAVELCFFNGR